MQWSNIESIGQSQFQKLLFVYLCICTRTSFWFNVEIKQSIFFSYSFGNLLFLSVSVGRNGVRTKILDLLREKVESVELCTCVLRSSKELCL